MAYTRQKTWVDNSGQQVDSAWLNTVEQALVDGFGVVPVTNGALVWDGAKFSAAALIKNAQIDPAAAIDYSKLNVPAGAISKASLAALNIANADVAAAAAIAGSKLDLTPVTSLPGSPTNGQVCVLTDSTTAPTFAWLMVYVQAASKWVFIGGSAINKEVLASEDVTSTSFTDLTTVGPFAGINWTGTYDFRVTSGHIQKVGTDDARIGLKIGAAVPEEISDDSAAANSSNGLSMAGGVRRAATAGDTVKLQYRTRAGGTHTFFYRELWITPVTLG